MHAAWTIMERLHNRNLNFISYDCHFISPNVDLYLAVILHSCGYCVYIYDFISHNCIFISIYVLQFDIYISQLCLSLNCNFISHYQNFILYTCKRHIYICIYFYSEEEMGHIFTLWDHLKVKKKVMVMSYRRLYTVLTLPYIFIQIWTFKILISLRNLN